jgi:hypothetical protein
VGEFNSVIHSQEKTEGRGMQIVSMFFLIPVISLLYTSIENQSLGSLFGALGFLVVVLLLFFMGQFQKRKYRKLGHTPLTLIPSFCTIGSKCSGSIEVSREQFNKVKTLSLSSWKYTRVSSDYRFEKVWEDSLPLTLKSINNKTILEFNFIIPIGHKPTYKSIFSKKKHHWEVHFEFVESMESITRTWKIPVKI